MKTVHRQFCGVRHEEPPIPFRILKKILDLKIFLKNLPKSYPLRTQFLTAMIYVIKNYQ